MTFKVYYNDCKKFKQNMGIAYYNAITKSADYLFRDCASVLSIYKRVHTSTFYIMLVEYLTRAVGSAACYFTLRYILSFRLCENANNIIVSFFLQANKKKNYAYLIFLIPHKTLLPAGMSNFFLSLSLSLKSGFDYSLTVYATAARLQRELYTARGVIFFFFLYLWKCAVSLPMRARFSHCQINYFTSERARCLFFGTIPSVPSPVAKLQLY